MNLSKRHLVLSCFLSIVHIERTETRVSLFNLRLERYPKVVKLSIKLLKDFSMTTTLSILVCLKLVFKILAGKNRLIKFTSTDAIGFYCTLNQKKAIDRLSKEIGSPYFNISPSYFYLFRAFIKSIIISFTKRKKLEKICQKEFNLLTEIIKYIFYYNYIDQYLKKFPLVSIIANDHSPEPLAFLTNAKLKSSKVVYLQHGHVSKYFPPLFRFDLSILYGQKSLDIYSEIGKVSDQTILSGYKFSPAKAIKPCPKGLNITIFPNVIVEARILKIVEELNNSKSIETIFIKPHPLHMVSSQLEKKLKHYSKVKVLPFHFDFRSETHVGLAGNSSIHMELLSEGIPTIYYDELDQIDYDYYNFVSSNAVLEIKDLKDLNSAALNEFYLNEQWKKDTEYFDAGFLKKDVLDNELLKIRKYFTQNTPK